MPVEIVPLREFENFEYILLTDSLRKLAKYQVSTWGYKPGVVAYLRRFDIPFPEGGICPLCASIITINKGDEWDKHMVTHRIWIDHGTNEPFDDGLSMHRFCECVPQPVKSKMWCSECCGYIRIL